MNFILACVIAATVSLQTVKLGTAPGKTMVVTGATVSAHAEITNTVTKAYVESLGIDVDSKRSLEDLNVYTKEVRGGTGEWSRVNLPSVQGSWFEDQPFIARYLDGTCNWRWNATNTQRQVHILKQIDVYPDYASAQAATNITLYLDYDFETEYVSTRSMSPVSTNLVVCSRLATTNEVPRIASDINAVPTSRKINGQPLTSDITIAAGVTSVNSKTGVVTLVASDVGAASSAELAPIAADVRTAYGYSRGTYLYMNANTNAWFAGTNYVFGADATNRTQFAWEAGMNTETVPCSMALYELRDGAKQCVWDQRDWTAWYWSFKASQMDARIQEQMAASNAAIRAEIASTNNHAWAKWYAASGRVNPDPTTTYVDTPKVCIAPGMNWETVAQVSGCGYWTIVGNGLVVGNAGTNAVLEIKDFEGNSIMTITKGQHRLAWLESEDFTGQMVDGDGWVCFDMMSESQPTGYYSTTLEEDSFVVQTDANCPAQYRWESIGSGKWRVHFLLKPGIVSDRCFAKYLSEIQGQTVIRYTAGAEISGGLIYNGKKIAPQIPSGAVVGDTITWKVVQ